MKNATIQTLDASRCLAHQLTIFMPNHKSTIFHVCALLTVFLLRAQGQDFSWCSNVKVLAGVVDGLSITPSVYDANGKWLGVVNGGFATFIVCTEQKGKSDRRVTELLTQLISKPPTKSPSDFDLPVGLYVPEMIAIYLPEVKRTYAIDVSQLHPLVHPLRRVVEGVYQFDAKQPTYVIEDKALKEELLLFSTKLSESAMDAKR